MFKHGLNYRETKMQTKYQNKSTQNALIVSLLKTPPCAVTFRGVGDCVPQ